MLDNYYYIKIKKMGQWALMPADSESWHGEHTAHYFRKLFGFGKGTLIIQTLKDELQHSYFPEHYFKRLYSFIENTNKKDFQELARKLKTFYPLRMKILAAVPKINPKDFSEITNQDLIIRYKKNRDWVHRVTIYDQFGWTAGDYWKPIIASILKKYGLQEGSKNYHKALFALTKPEEISTTLKEKQATLLEVIKIKEKKQTLDKASGILTRKYGWMPVFTYGTPWDKNYFYNQLKELLKRNLSELKKEYLTLENYTNIRNKEFNATAKKYHINKKDLQIFIDFSLVIDAQNEAEYMVSFISFYLLPFYKEISRRLKISVNQVRTLFENEIIKALRGKINAKKILKEKGDICGWGFNKEMTRRYNFSQKDSLKLFKHLEKTAENIHGLDETKGLCANIGIKRGRAKILLSPKDNGKVEEGDILIAHATTVDYLPAMKKAAAFVTEVGGLTCHAAVVAREFGVPCIVSLKNATKKYKDGDLVKVIAEKGVVEKL